MEKSIEAIKEFFFDIVGFLVPGVIVIELCLITFQLEFEHNNLNPYIYTSLAYVIGYIVFSATLVKEMLINKITNSSSQKTIEKKLCDYDIYKIASEIMDNATNSTNHSLNNFKSRRNIAISSNPEQERKIFTFMFRAELFNQLHTISLISLLGFILLLFGSIFYEPLKLHTSNLDPLWILLFIACSLILRKGWARFYTIAMIIPFSIYVEKKHNINNR